MKVPLGGVMRESCKLPFRTTIGSAVLIYLNYSGSMMTFSINYILYAFQPLHF